MSEDQPPPHGEDTSDFPVDDATLVLLAAACRINPDTGQTHLGDFLNMGAVVESVEEIDDDGMGGPPVFYVEYVAGREPFSPHHVIRALVAEIQRLRMENERLSNRLRDAGLGGQGSHRQKCL